MTLDQNKFFGLQRALISQQKLQNIVKSAEFVQYSVSLTQDNPIYTVQLLQERWMLFAPPLTQGHSYQQCKNNLAITTFEYIKTIGTPLTVYNMITVHPVHF